MEGVSTMKKVCGRGKEKENAAEEARGGGTLQPFAGGSIPAGSPPGGHVAGWRAGGERGDSKGRDRC